MTTLQRFLALPAAVGFALLFIPHVAAAGEPTAQPLLAISGADGVFEVIKIDGREVRRGAKSGDAFSPFIYFRLPEKFPQPPGPVYVEIDFLDIGNGRFELQYNAAKGENYRRAEHAYAVKLTDSGKPRKAVFQLAAPDFRHAQNLNADLRLATSDQKAPLHIVSATLHSKPTALFEARHSRPWLKPYTGPTKKDVNATSLHKKVLCGYQGWFRTPGDDAEVGWIHWSRDANRISPKSLTFEMWPDLSEFSDDEKYPAPGFTHPDGTQAYLFSSAHPKTVDRHFDWMARYGIDGVLVQRFVLHTQDPAEASRVLGYARAAANRTGRVFAVEYDMSGTPPEQLHDRLVADWNWLVDEMKITRDPRYLHHEGKPVLAIFGFFSDRFEAKLAHKIIDFFKKDPRYSVCLIGGCQWHWRTEKNADWAKVFRRFDVINPWNVGHTAKLGAQVHAATHPWPLDQAEARKYRMEFMPVIYPGFSWDNLMRKPAGSTLISRLGGEFYWRQFSVAADLRIDMVKVAMFDEVDEGTAIFKVTNTPPTQAHFVTYDGRPSDWYLRLTGEGTRLIQGKRANSKAIPIKAK